MRIKSIILSIDMIDEKNKYLDKLNAITNLVLNNKLKDTNSTCKARIASGLHEYKRNIEINSITDKHLLNTYT